MGKSKVIFGDEVLIDLTGDSVTADKVLKNVTFHGADGEPDSGTCTYDSDTSGDTAKVAEILATKTAHARGTKLEGTMPNRGAVTGTIITRDGKYTIQQGYHDGSGTVGLPATEIAKLIPANIRGGVTILGVVGDMTEDTENPQDSVTVTPTKAQQTITPTGDHTCFRQVIVNGIPYAESPNSAGGTTVTIG